jgi:hypothetical protein
MPLVVAWIAYCSNAWQLRWRHQSWMILSKSLQGAISTTTRDIPLIIEYIQKELASSIKSRKFSHINQNLSHRITTDSLMMFVTDILLTMGHSNENADTLCIDAK